MIKKLFFLLFTVIIAASCSTIKVTSDFDGTTQFASYKTYAFTPEALSLPVNDLNQKRVIEAVETQLAAKGFTKSEKPDVFININIKAKEVQTATATSTPGYYGYGYGYGYRYGYGGGYSSTTVNYDSYLEGTLFVDIIDVSKLQLVWQGRAVATIDEDATQKKREQNINYAVKKIFSQYPPKK
jgi:hypothetical protein